MLNREALPCRFVKFLAPLGKRSYLVFLSREVKGSDVVSCGKTQHQASKATFPAPNLLPCSRLLAIRDVMMHIIESLLGDAKFLE